MEKSPPVIESVLFRPTNWEVPSPVDVMAQMSDGSDTSLFSYFADEIRVTAADLIGLTVEEARRLHHDKDVGWLSS